MSNKDNFIMLPTNDFCFKELMQNPKVRKGFIGGILRKDPEEIRETILLPTETRRDYADDKLKKCIHVGVLNFIYYPDIEDCYHKINLCNSKTGEVYSDLFELHVLELPKLPQVLAKMEEGEDVSDESIIQWMEFFSGKTQEDFEAMAKQNEYMEEAVNTLFELSAEQHGMERGIEITRRILKLKTEGKSAEQIAEKCDLPLEQIKEIMEW